MAPKRVTHLIKEYRLCGDGDYAFVKPEVMRKASERGSYIHECCELWHSGELDEDAIEEEWRGYFEAYKKFVTDAGWEPDRFEAEFKSAFVGHVDQIGTSHPGRGRRHLILRPTRLMPIVLEVKTAVPLPAHRVQVSAYWYLYEQLHNDPTAEAWILYLKADGKYKLVVIDALERREHITSFLGALQVDFWRQKYIREKTQ